MKLHMIGYSHIDAVWFWTWDEGLQEVKSTFASALDRMREFPDFIFTATSTQYLEWIEKTDPSMFAEIKERVREGRFRIAGPWLIESDTSLPSGEALIRQGLYGQAYLKEKFGFYASTQLNVDAFGHSNAIPQILKTSGIENYVFMRPQLKGSALFRWQGDDGSRINCVSLPGEYTTWTYETTKEEIEKAIRAAEELSADEMLSFYGVGNHGGGPTIANIESIGQIQKLTEWQLEFSDPDTFFATNPCSDAPVRKDYLDHVAVGAYSMDAGLKKANRETERSLLQTEFLLAIESSILKARSKSAEDMKVLWKQLLFNHFHDTIAGTIIPQAREEAVREMASVRSACKSIQTFVIQKIVNHYKTQGDYFPLFLFNLSGQSYSNPVELEIPWPCQEHIRLLDPDGNEIPYQRTYTEAKARNYHIGGRRRIIFNARIPAGGFAVYRIQTGMPTLATDVRVEAEFPLPHNPVLWTDNPYRLENDKLRVLINEEGFITSLYDKVEAYEALKEPIRYPIWVDQRDAWGGLQFRSYHKSGKGLEFQSIQLIESGNIRKVVRLSYQSETYRLIQDLILYKHAAWLEVQNHLQSTGEWLSLHMEFAGVSGVNLTAEKAFGVYKHQANDGTDYCMHRFLDLTDEKDRGLLIVNDSKYAYHAEEDTISLILCRNAINAQGYGPNWYQEKEYYSYADQGNLAFNFILKPHGKALTPKLPYDLAAYMEKPIKAVLDSKHKGIKELVPCFTLAGIAEDQAILCAIKDSEDGLGTIFRVLEVAGIGGTCHLHYEDKVYPIEINPYEILTLRLEKQNLYKVNALENLNE